MTSPSERFTVTLDTKTARDLRALALRYDNTAARLAAAYIKDGITHAWVREARLWELAPEAARAAALADLKLAEDLDCGVAPAGVVRPAEAPTQGGEEA